MKSSALFITLAVLFSSSKAAIDMKFFNEFPNFYTNNDFWGGFILGLQEDPTDQESPCFGAYIELSNAVA